LQIRSCFISDEKEIGDTSEYRGLGSDETYVINHGTFDENKFSLGRIESLTLEEPKLEALNAPPVVFQTHNTIIASIQVSL